MKLLPNRGHKNLKRGSKKGDPQVTKKRAILAKDPVVKRISLKLLKRPAYQADLARRLDDGTLHPSLQVMLWQYGYGKPKEEIEVSRPVPVTIKHEYSE